MPFRFTPSALAAAAAFSALGPASGVQAATAVETHQPTVVVSATRIALPDSEAPYASEIHTREDLDRSGAHTLYDYLAQQTSLQLMPSAGNRHAPNITTRGFGEDGHQNLVISVNGRRLNNIDMVPQLIGSVTLHDIERIEITKGSGAVMFGDGAAAGSIQIYTRARDTSSLDLYAGNYGQRGAVASTGLVKDHYELSFTAEQDRLGGWSAPDASGAKDSSKVTTWHAGAAVQPNSDLRLDLEAGASRFDTRYPNPLSASEFATDPGMNTRPYTPQLLHTQHWRAGAEYQLAPHWQLRADHSHETKDSRYPSYGSSANYRTLSNELALQYQHGVLTVNAGVQHFDGLRASGAERTSKTNLGAFVHGTYLLETWTLSAGLRREQVEHRNRPGDGSDLREQQYLTSWELGANQRLSPTTTVFASYSNAFVTPDIDRFFVVDWNTYQTSFNGFITPAKARTLTVGSHYETPRQRLKLSAFYSRLHDEIYMVPWSYMNTNIDRSHKYGLELQEQLQLSPRVSALLNYAWTHAKIDAETVDGQNFAGKQLPGVPTHSLTLGLNVRMAQHGNLHLSHTWRNSAWAYGNFANDPAFRQPVYQSTDVAYRHQMQRNVELYASVSNLLDKANSVAISSTQLNLYPTNFARTWKLGARWTF